MEKAGKFTRVLAGGSLMWLVACGSGFSGAKSPPNEEGLRQAIRGSTTALFKPDVKAFYKYLSNECRETVTVGDLTFALMFGGAFLEGMSGTKMSEFRVGDIEIRSITPTTAEARFGVVLEDGAVFAATEDSEWSTWLYEDDGWKTTDCEDFGSTGEIGDIKSSSEGPSCGQLISGQPVPDDFSEESRVGFNLDCYDEFEDPIYSSDWKCLTSDRRYVQSELGYAFLDERIFQTGNVVGCLPQCSLLVSGQPVPEIFADTSREGFNLECEDPNGNPYFSYSWDCWDSDREYVQSENGYTFVDDRVFQTGDGPSC